MISRDDDMVHQLHWSVQEAAMSRDYQREDPQDTGYNAREAFSNIRDKATEFTSKVKEKATQAGGTVSEAANRLAEGVESTATYLRDRNVQNIGSDLLDTCRRNPGKAVLSALAVGFLAGVFIRRK
jgi:ElaB/YqjD/DUF883 family membrane-anchored ribosome-binding protein